MTDHHGTRRAGECPHSYPNASVSVYRRECDECNAEHRIDVGWLMRERDAMRAEVERLRAFKKHVDETWDDYTSKDTAKRENAQLVDMLDKTNAMMNEAMRRAEQMTALARRLAEALVDTLGSYFRCTVCHATSSAKGCREFNGVWREYDPFYVHEEDCELGAALREAREAGVVE